MVDSVEDRLAKAEADRKSTRLNSSHSKQSRMPSSACCDWSSDVCRTPLNWIEPGERRYFGIDFVNEAEEQVRIINTT